MHGGLAPNWHLCKPFLPVRLQLDLRVKTTLREPNKVRASEAVRPNSNEQTRVIEGDRRMLGNALRAAQAWPGLQANYNDLVKSTGSSDAKTTASTHHLLVRVM